MLQSRVLSLVRHAPASWQIHDTLSEYHLGLATPNLLPVLNEIRGGKTPKLRILNVEFQTVQMSQARVMGVSEEWIEKTETADPERHQLFMVRKVDSGHGDGLNEGDVLLTLNGKLVTRSPDLDVMYNNEFLDAVVVRKREEKTIKVSTVATEDLETDRLVSFCGATFHRPHQAVRQQISKIHSDVYISSRARGSPAYMYGVSAHSFPLWLWLHFTNHCTARTYKLCHAREQCPHSQPIGLPHRN